MSTPKGITVRELIALLLDMPRGAPVLVDGYEGGLTALTSEAVSVRKVGPYYLAGGHSFGEWDLYEDVDWDLCKSSEDENPPVTAVLLRRND